MQPFKPLENTECWYGTVSNILNGWIYNTRWLYTRSFIASTSRLSQTPTSHAITDMKKKNLTVRIFNIVFEWLKAIRGYELARAHDAMTGLLITHNTNLKGNQHKYVILDKETEGAGIKEWEFDGSRIIYDDKSLIKAEAYAHMNNGSLKPVHWRPGGQNKYWQRINCWETTRTALTRYSAGVNSCVVRVGIASRFTWVVWAKCAGGRWWCFLSSYLSVYG